ncbi:MAG TPA: trifunctional transcriptional activator/DNA repair protein Ada/methylated-DNA--[protein]-cysteine S-methyltransferase, partial [Phycisphaerales bacterium]|nr:trifunctional transcriptional activator/DNA repair protein Ada/methylated-DNA--[protein]-cysteine S-methyltransferase [Phycisphaerales bacterium]
MIMLPTADVMYRAVVKKDPAFDGVFFTAVKTTGIFCRPTCSSRKPRRENVEFFNSAREALHAGYRPCRRCKPMDSATSEPAWVRTLLNKIDAAPTSRIKAADLRSLSIDPSRAARWFKSHYGMTFQAYHRARRMGTALGALRNGASVSSSVSRAALKSGFNSESGFRDAFNRILGATPTKATVVQTLTAKIIQSPLGSMLAIAGDDGLALLEFVDRRMLETQMITLRRRFACAVLPGEHPHLTSITNELDRYFAGTLRAFKTPIALRGTPFQLKVWNRLMSIPYGRTNSYVQM